MATIMATKDIIKNCTNIVIQLSADQLEQFARDLVHETIQQTKEIEPQQCKEEKNGSLISAQDVADLFNVSKMTLYRWHKAKYLQRVKFGGKLWYRKEDVENFQRSKEYEQE